MLIGPLRLLSLAGRLPISDERLAGGEAKPRQNHGRDSARHAANESARSNLKERKGQHGRSGGGAAIQEGASFFLQLLLSSTSLSLSTTLFFFLSLLVFCVYALVPFPPLLLRK